MLFRRFYLGIDVRVREQALSLRIALYKTSAWEHDKEIIRAHIYEFLEHRISDIHYMSGNGTHSVDLIHSLYAEQIIEADQVERQLFRYFRVAVAQSRIYVRPGQ